MYILGISAFYHDSAAVLIHDGEIISAVQEERFTRIKHDSSFPINAISWCLSKAGISEIDLDQIVYYENPFKKATRIAWNALKELKFTPYLWNKGVINNLSIKKLITEFLPHTKAKISFLDHHLSHAASAFFPSPFEHAAILTIDGVGEWTTASWAEGKNNKIVNHKKMTFPNSVGLLYSAFTYYCGFKVNSGEYKLMGLAPYGTPRYRDLILDKIVSVKEDGIIELNKNCFNFSEGPIITNEFCRLMGKPQREKESQISQYDTDVASSIQVVTEEIVCRMANSACNMAKSRNLVMAGGVALNCVSNGKLIANKVCENFWVQPASGDAGTALGAALFYWYKNNKRSIEKPDSQRGSLLGPSFSNKSIQYYLDTKKLNYKYYENEDQLLEEVSHLLTQGKVIGWFHGAMEFGPRALGARSILGDPRNVDMQSIMNLKIKFRESFRPFAPVVLLEDSEKYFNLNSESPYMLLVSQLNKSICRKVCKSNTLIERVKQDRSEIPAVTHVDFSARVQTVGSERNPRFYKLLKQFKKDTDCSVLINTSFNVRGEPIVHTPKDAFNCFANTEMDVLVLENYIINKSELTLKNSRKDYLSQFAID